MTTESGINNATVRVENRRKLTKLLYEEEALTRQALIGRLQLSAPTVKLLIQQLEADGLISYQSATHSSGGRVPDLVCFNYNAFYAIGIEISQYHNRILVINMKCDTIDQSHVFCRFEDTRDYWESISKRLDSILEKDRIPREQVLGVGLAIPGPVRQTEKKFSSWLLNLQDYSYQNLEEIFGFTVIAENDANAAGYAEIWLGRNLNDAVYLSVSKGVGGAIINNRSVMRGQGNCSGEFGHMIIVPNGRQCLCGRRGCLDMYCSTTQLLQYCEGDIDSFFKKKDSDPKLQLYWQEYLQYLAIGISNLALSLDLPVVLGGEITPYIAQNFEEFQEIILAMDPFNRELTATCTLSRLSENGAATGAALFKIIEYLEIGQV